MHRFASNFQDIQRLGLMVKMGPKIETQNINEEMTSSRMVLYSFVARSLFRVIFNLLGYFTDNHLWNGIENVIVNFVWQFVVAPFQRLASMHMITVPFVGVNVESSFIVLVKICMPKRCKKQNNQQQTILSWLFFSFSSCQASIHSIIFMHNIPFICIDTNEWFVSSPICSASRKTRTYR